MTDYNTIPEPKARDYYHDLGIDYFADDNQIGAAFRQLAKKWHPDRIAGINPVDAVEFRRAREAYDILKDPIKRYEYDLYDYVDIREAWRRYYAMKTKREQQAAASTKARKRKANAEADRRREEQRREEKERREADQRKEEKERKEADKRRDEEEAERQIRRQNRILEVEARERERVAREELRRKADAEARLQKENAMEQQRKEEEARVAEKQKQDFQQLLDQSKLKVAAETESHTAQSEQAELSKLHEEKQKQADERSRRVAEDAQARNVAAAEDRLRRQEEQEFQQTPFKSSAQANQTPSSSSSSNLEERSRGLKMKMAREWAHTRYREALKNAGGPAHEDELFEVRIDLGWDKIIATGQCLVCRTKIKSKYMFRCPDGGATACPGCKAKYATFRGV